MPPLHPPRKGEQGIPFSKLENRRFEEEVRQSLNDSLPRMREAAILTTEGQRVIAGARVSVLSEESPDTTWQHAA